MIGGLIFQVIGATAVWICKGFKGSFNNEMAGPNDRGWKRYRNIVISIIIIFFMIELFDL
jgi:hypothetical protein